MRPILFVLFVVLSHLSQLRGAEYFVSPSGNDQAAGSNNAALTMDDMGFKNAAKLDFRMSGDAPAFQKVPGFEAIPFEKIGLHTDEHRTKLPEHPSGHTTSEWHRDRSKDK